MTVGFHPTGQTEQTKKQLSSLKSQSSGDSRKILKETINDGKKVTIFILKFTEKIRNSEFVRSSERIYYEYCESSVTVELTSSVDSSKRLINAYLVDLFILALTGGSESYTLSFKK